MRVLKFGNRDIKIDFSEPATIELLEAKIHKSLLDLLMVNPRISDIAALLECGSCGTIESKEECYELFKVYEGGAYTILKELVEELSSAGWLGIAGEQLKDES
ncbi:MAG: hypothetical protein WCQ65_12310, partial [Fermentimonas sp.]